AYFQKEKTANPNTIVVTAGDAFGASPPLSGAFDDKPAIQALNFLGVAVDTFGNHNFDKGVDYLKARIGEATYTYVSTNLTNVTTELGAKVATPFHIVEVGSVAP